MNGDNIAAALQSGLFAAFVTVALLGVAVYFSPEEWRVLAAIISGAAAIAFWVGFLVRLTGSDVLTEFGLKYPDLRSDASIHKELDAMRQEIEKLRGKLS